MAVWLGKDILEMTNQSITELVSQRHPQRIASFASR